MTNIHVDTLLYCGTETVAVVETTPVSFWAKFQLTHTANFTITSSSLAGLQLNPGSNYPVFTVQSVHSATVVEMEQPWGGPTLANQTYQIQKMYCTVDPNLKVLLDCVDQQVGRQLQIYTPLQKVNLIDPQRTATGDPLALVQHTPTDAGSMQYEIWPTPTAARQLWVICGLTWPELRAENDRPPWFIDSTMFVDGAIADMLRIRTFRYGPSLTDQTDPFFDPQLAAQYEAKYERGLLNAVNQDEAKAQKSYDHAHGELLGAGGSQYWQRHDWDVVGWRL